MNVSVFNPGTKPLVIENDVKLPSMPGAVIIGVVLSSTLTKLLSTANWPEIESLVGVAV